MALLVLGYLKGLWGSNMQHTAISLVNTVCHDKTVFQGATDLLQ